LKRLIILASLASLDAADLGTPVLRNEGLTALGRGDWAAAALAFDQVVAAHPQDADAWVFLGIARWHHGRIDQALVALDQALRGNPSLAARARYYRALALTALGRDDEAAQEFAALVERFPHSDEAARVRAATVPGGSAAQRSVAGTSGLRAWRLDAGLSLVHDSNPERMNPDLIADPDADAMTDAFATVRWTKPSRRLGIMLAGRSEDYARRDDLDTISAQGRAWVGLVSDARDEFRLGGSSTRTWLGHAPFRWRHAAEASWWHALEGRWSSLCEASVAAVRHDQEEDGGLDGMDYRGDAGLLWEADGSGLLRSVEGHVGLGRGSAELKELASTQCDGILAADWRLGAGWAMRWSVEGGYRLFAKGSGDTPGEARTDTWMGAGASLEWQVASWCTLALHGYGERTASNVALYEHDLLLTSGQVRLAW
jgi:tetratricopeptide (TPR) repeat protein